MKSILIFITLLSGFSMIEAQANEKVIECKTERQWLGVYTRECPLGAVVTGVDVRPAGPNFLWTYVECERHTVVCEEKERKPLDPDTKPYYNEE